MSREIKKAVAETMRHAEAGRLGPPPDELPADVPKCADCKHVVWEGAIFQANIWDAIHCGRWRETLDQSGIKGRPEKACWWERYNGIGRCGAGAAYFERAPKKLVEGR